MNASLNRLAAVALASLSAACAAPSTSTTSTPMPDPRVGLAPGLMDAGEAVGNLKVLSKVPSPPGFLGVTNSDLAFTGNYAIQGNYNGLQIWDMSDPASPTLVTAFPCPASQNDVSVYRNLLFMSSEGMTSRMDCRPSNTRDSVGATRVRGVRIFDISDIRTPKLVSTVQTCRGSHTHTVVEDPRDRDNIYIYVSGSAPMRPTAEMDGCVSARPDSNPNSALWRIEVIKVPVGNPAAAAIVSRADIFTGLKAPAEHGEAEEDMMRARRTADSARARGAFVVELPSGTSRIPVPVGSGFVRPLLDSTMRARGGTGTPTGADSTALRGALQGIIDRMFGASDPAVPGVSSISVNRQCHDITVYPSIGLAGGACEGHGMLLDIRDPANPRRVAAVSDSNFAYWHSATFNNDGTKILFSDEWGGGGGAKCRATDRKEWGANAIFEIVNGQMEFRSYYKLPAAQTDKENCVAHNGSLIPIPDRDVMVQSWYQGGISVFDFTDARNPVEIAYFDRGPSDTTRIGNAGSWSAYWYNGTIVSSEIGRGIDMLAMTPSLFVTQNEIDAANTVRLPYFNAQGQPKYTWPPSFPLARAYIDQLERKKCLSSARIVAVRNDLAAAERAQDAQRANALQVLASSLDADKSGSCDVPKLNKLQAAINDLARPMVP